MKGLNSAVLAQWQARCGKLLIVISGPLGHRRENELYYLHKDQKKQQIC